jgi:hypothetical protein
MKIQENLGNAGKSRKITKISKIHGNARKFVKIKKMTSGINACFRPKNYDLRHTYSESALNSEWNSV